MNFKRYQFLKEQAIRNLKDIPRSTAFSAVPEKNRGVVLATCQQVAREDSLMLAYIGDGVYSLYIREQLLATGITQVRVLHDLVTEFICAKAQADALFAIEKDGPILTEEEQLVIRRARNSNVNVPKSATVKEYRSSTAYEALIGYLYRSGQYRRMILFMETAFTMIMEKQHG